MNMIHVLHLVICWMLIVAVALPIIKNDYWIFRVFEYPRYQKFVFCFLALISLLFFYNNKSTFDIVTLACLGGALVYLAVKIFPYTPLAKKEMKGIAGKNQSNQLRIFTANVLQTNEYYFKMIEQVRENDPDIILLVETDRKWEKEMDVLIKDYPYYLKEPLDNTYGILFYSRLQIEEGKIQYLVEDEVPSIEATVKLPSGQLVKVWCLHPKPPVPGEDNRSSAKDKEIMKVAFKAKKEKLPTIVMGDLNDVAWSYVTKLFRKTSGLLDPRRGRGFFSTFSANNWFMRFPLDYVFCSSHFGLINMKRMEHNGSDHFAIFSHFEYQQVLEQVQEKPTADSAENIQAQKKATQEV